MNDIIPRAAPNFHLDETMNLQESRVQTRPGPARLLESHLMSASAIRGFYIYRAIIAVIIVII